MSRPAKKAAIVACHHSHPTWTATKIAKIVGCTRAYVRLVVINDGLDMPRQYRKNPPTMKAAIVACHEQIPTWGTSMIAESVGCTDAYVREVARTCSLDIPTHYGRPRRRPHVQVSWMLSEPG